MFQSLIASLYIWITLFGFFKLLLLLSVGNWSCVCEGLTSNHVPGVGCDCDSGQLTLYVPMQMDQNVFRAIVKNYKMVLKVMYIYIMYVCYV